MPNARIRGKQFDLDYCDRNPYRLLQQGLATLVRIAQSEDLKHALVAGQWLVDYGERLMVDRANNKPQPVSRQAANRNQIINELRGLYAQALGSAPIVLDAQVEPEAAQTVQGQPPARDRS